MAKEKETCSVCRQPKATIRCGSCEDPLCKSCEHFLEPDSFSFLEPVPKELQLIHYCPACYEEKVEPARESYERTMAAAKEVNIFFLADRNVPQLLKKSQAAIHVKDCRDRDETILRLGFKAAELGFNSVVKVDVVAKQIRNLAYQTSAWQGTGIPADIDEAKFSRFRG